MNLHAERLDAELTPLTTKLASQGAHHVFIAVVPAQSIFHIKSDLLLDPQYPGLLEAIADKLREQAAEARLKSGIIAAPFNFEVKS